MFDVDRQKIVFPSRLLRKTAGEVLKNSGLKKTYEDWVEVCLKHPNFSKGVKEQWVLGIVLGRANMAEVFREVKQRYSYKDNAGRKLDTHEAVSYMQGYGYDNYPERVAEIRAIIDLDVLKVLDDIREIKHTEWVVRYVAMYERTFQRWEIEKKLCHLKKQWQLKIYAVCICNPPIK